MKINIMMIGNRLKNLTVVSIFTAILAPFSFGQYADMAFHKYDFPDSKKDLSTAKTNLRIGDEHYRAASYYHAIKPYQKAHDFNPDNSVLNAKLADCYFHTSDYVKAEKHIERAVELNENVDGYYWYLKAYLKQFQGLFEDALKDYFTAEDKPSVLMKDINAQIKERIMECKRGEKMMNHPEDVSMFNMGDNINTPNNEYIPIIDEKGTKLIFTSRRENVYHAEIDESLGDYFEDLYVSHRTNKGWTEAENYAFPFNTQNHDATIALSNDGLRMLVYRDDSVGNGDIYLSVKEPSGYWNEPVRLPAPINTEHHETAAYFSPDMKHLYFVSDRPEGHGGKDIYRSEILDDLAFGPAENLGTNINTDLDDDGVFLFGKELGEMYFSSEGHAGMGGHDIYKSVWKDSAWGPAINMGYPINSAGNDVAFVRSLDSLHGFLSSSRSDTRGRYDIYQIKFNKYMYLPELETLPVDVSGFIVDGADGTPLKAIVTVYDAETGDFVASDVSDSCTGEYNLLLDDSSGYMMDVEINGYLTHEQPLELGDGGKIVATPEIKMSALAVGLTVELKDVYYDLDKYALADSSYENLDKIVEMMKNNPTIRLEISSHTDSRGTDEYNQRLSNNRAQTCVDYLLSKGIPEESLVAKGYGEFKLLISDADMEGLTDEEQEAAHQKNRRTEFKVIE